MDTLEIQRFSELQNVEVQLYNQDLSQTNKMLLKTLSPHCVDIYIKRGEKAGDKAVIPLLEEYKELLIKAERLRVQQYAKDLKEKRDVAKEIMDELRINGYRIGCNQYNSTLRIHHGTSKQIASKILSEGKFNKMSYFSHAKTHSAFGSAGAKDYGNTIISIFADPRDISFNSGSGEIEAVEGLVKDEDGVWKSPNRVQKKEISNY